MESIRPTPNLSPPLLEESNLTVLRALLRGNLQRPDAGPALIVTCKNIEDVVTGLHFAHAYDLPVVVRGAREAEVEQPINGCLVLDFSDVTEAHEETISGLLSRFKLPPLNGLGGDEAAPHADNAA